MSSLRHFCVATVLIFTLAVPTLAGDMQCGVVSQPPPDTSITSVTGEIATGAATTNETSAETTYVDPVTEIALSLLQGVLALF
jgi:hypothetical protein